MVTAASGSFAKAKLAAANILAASSSFQTWTTSADSTAAAKRIHFDIGPTPYNLRAFTADELRTLRPLAVIRVGEADGLVRRRIAVGVGHSFAEGGMISMMLEDDLPPNLVDGEDPIEALRLFENNVGDVIDDLCANAGRDYLTITRITTERSPQRGSIVGREAQGELFFTSLAIQWSQE